MTLRELLEEELEGSINIAVLNIAVCVVDQDNVAHTDYIEYADELLETHGDIEVENYQYFPNKNLLAVVFKED